MHSSLIGKIEKARRYADERTRRVEFCDLKVTFHGENDDHEVRMIGKRWYCSCDYFSHERICSHVMTMERVLDGMVPLQQTEQPVVVPSAASVA